MHFEVDGASYRETMPDGAPVQRDIRCPRCQSRALFDEPFAFYHSKRGKPVAYFWDPEAPSPWSLKEVDLSNFQVKTWGGWFVVERYPSILPWQPEPSGYCHGTGIVKCTGCRAVFIHTLCWPDDAFYRWIIRGATFWAWSRDHAEILLQFLRGADRDPLRYPRFRRSHIVCQPGCS
jgi:hypothetical protein